MTKTQEKKLLASRHDSRRYLKRHPPRRSAPPHGVVELARVAVEQHTRQKKLVQAKIAERATPPRRRGPSAEDVLLRALPGGVQGEAYLAVEWALRLRPRPEGDALVAAVARKLWTGGVRIGHQ